MRKVSEGAVVAIPLRGDGWGLGVVGRASASGQLIVYFFGAQEPVASFKQVEELKRHSAIAVARVGDLRIRNGSWPILGYIDPWVREEWRQTWFLRFEELTGRTYRVEYDDIDSAKVIGESLVAPGTEEQGPSDGLYGAAAAEGFLKRLLGRHPQPGQD